MNKFLQIAKNEMADENIRTSEQNSNENSFNPPPPSQPEKRDLTTVFLKTCFHTACSYFLLEIMILNRWVAGSFHVFREVENFLKQVFALETGIYCHVCVCMYVCMCVYVFVLMCSHSQLSTPPPRTFFFPAGFQPNAIWTWTAEIFGRGFRKLVFFRWGGFQSVGTCSFSRSIFGWHRRA